MIEIQARCDECNNILDAEVAVRNKEPVVRVQPCETCLENTARTNYEEGKIDGGQS